MAKVKTFEAACKQLGLNPEKVLPNVTGMPKHHQAATIAHAKLVIIAEAINDGWKPNWMDDDEYKYYPWFDMSSPSGPAFDDYVRWRSGSDVGSRLCYKSRELAEYAGKQFEKLYREYFSL